MALFRIFFYAAVLGLAVQEPEALRLSQPAPPQPTARRNAEVGTAVFNLHIDANGDVVQTARIQGQQWAIEPALYALYQWKFNSGPAHASATFVFKTKTVLPDEPQTLKTSLGGEASEAPLPLTLVVPGYPIGGFGQGSVIIQAQIDPSGKVVKTDVIWPLASLTDTAVEAVKQWTFSQAGVAIVVISFQWPEYLS